MPDKDLIGLRKKLDISLKNSYVNMLEEKAERGQNVVSSHHGKPFIREARRVLDEFFDKLKSVKHIPRKDDDMFFE
jgi:hypothetical protein